VWRLQWLCVWDHLVTAASDPLLFSLAVVAYLISVRVSLLCVVPSAAATSTSTAAATSGATMRALSRDATTVDAATASRDELSAFLRHPAGINVQNFLKRLYALRARTPTHMVPAPGVSAWPGATLGSHVFGGGGVAVEPGDPPVAPVRVAEASLLAGRGPAYTLPVGSYPPFMRFPRYMVDFQLRERERIALEEEGLQQRKALIAELARRKYGPRVCHIAATGCAAALPLSWWLCQNCCRALTVVGRRPDAVLSLSERRGRGGKRRR
jgi:hypothetical protein